MQDARRICWILREVQVHMDVVLDDVALGGRLTAVGGRLAQAQPHVEPVHRKNSAVRVARFFMLCVLIKTTHELESL